jgi:UDP-N-acetylglucosamine 4-epimerase
VRGALQRQLGADYLLAPAFRDFRAGDVRHSLASIERARTMIGYEPTHRVAQGIDEAIGWYARRARTAAAGGG